MEAITYTEFVALVKQYKIFPFSPFVPEHPALTTVASGNDWHTDSATDPWGWRVQIVQDYGVAYGKFFGSKACFVDGALFPALRSVLSANRSVEERYRDGMFSATAYRIYQALEEHGTADARHLRGLAGCKAKEKRKDYERALVELQNSGDIVIIGAAKQNEAGAGWSSMCYQQADAWLQAGASRGQEQSEPYVDLHSATQLLAAELSPQCSARAYRYFAKKLGLPAISAGEREE